EEVEVAIPVVIKRRTAGSEARLGAAQPSFLRDSRESSISAVAIARVLAPISDEQVVEAIVVIVSHRDAVGAPCAEQPCFFCDIGKSAVSVILVEAICCCCRRIVLPGP